LKEKSFFRINMMIYFIHLRNDIRQIVRDPVMLALMLAPLLVFAVFKLLLVFLLPVISGKTGIDYSPWYPYLLSFIMLLIPGMLGIVTGFLMIDERDGNIAELMSVTPMGRSGYLLNRLLFSGSLCIAWCMVGYFSLDLVPLPFFSLIFLSLLLALESAIIGLLLFNGADDKVKGLTYAKGLNILNLFAFSDLLALKWLIVLSWLFPSYWITAVIKNPFSPVVAFSALSVHVIWLSLLIARFTRRRS